MRGHCFFVVAEAAEGGVQGVLAHWPGKASQSGKYEASGAGEWLQLAKNCDGLFRRRDDVRTRIFIRDAGTLANEMSHLHAVLKQVGKQSWRAIHAYSNRCLGFAPGSCIGTKRPLSDAQIRACRRCRNLLGRRE